MIQVETDGYQTGGGQMEVKQVERGVGRCNHVRQDIMGGERWNKVKTDGGGVKRS